VIQKEKLSTTLSSKNETPIGVFDSGVGGISVLQHISKALPNESILYYADSLNAPYGNKSPEFIIERACYLTEFLIEQGAKAIVVACNTATAAAVTTLRQKYPLPIVAMEPAVKPAVAMTKSGVIGVLATSGTLKSAQFAALLEHYGHDVKVVTQACHGLVEAIEAGELDAPSTTASLRTYLEPLLNANADVIVLGCTHYPFVKSQIESIVAGKAALIDTGEAVARQLKKRLMDEGILKSSPESSLTLWSNSHSAYARDVITRLLQKPENTWQLNVVV